MLSNISSQKYYWLDLIRFLAAFVVLASHYRGAFFVEYAILPNAQQNIFSSIFFFVTRLGEESVLIFFVLSGFLVGGKSIEKIIKAQVNVKSYILDRAVRIFLPLFASVLLVIVLDLIMNDKIPFLDIAGSILSLQGLFTDCYSNAPLWSLSYEVWFYIMTGCILVMFSKSKIKFGIVSFIVLTICFLVFLKLDSKYLFIWSLGALAFHLPKLASFKKNTARIFLGLFVVAGIVLSQLTSESRSGLMNLDFISRDVILIVLGAAVALFILTIIELKPKNRFSNYFERMGGKLAVFSYSLYLTHYPLMEFLRYLGLPKSKAINLQSIGLFILEISIALLVGYGVYLISEKHTKKVKMFFTSKSSSLTSAS